MKKLQIERNEKKCKFCKNVILKEECIKINGFTLSCCKECYQLDNQKEWRKKHEIFKQNRLKIHRFYKSQYRKNHPEHALWRSARQRARRNNLPFNIEISDIIIPEYCPILGLKLKQSKVRMNDASPTLDKIVPDLGYIKGNICVLSNKANRIKGDGTIEEHQKIINFLEKYV